MFRASVRFVCLNLGALMAMLVAVGLVHAQQPQDGNGGQQIGSPQGGNGGYQIGPPVYQRHAFDWKHGERDWRRDRFRRRTPFASPQVSSGWFQRPYPYHLDYYKMRWGGSYAPYFGNLYGTPFGTPQVVNGGYGPGGWGPEYGGYPPQGVDEAVGYQGGYPPGVMMNAPPQQGQDATTSSTVQAPESGSTAGQVSSGTEGQQQQSGNESLPVPGQ